MHCHCLPTFLAIKSPAFTYSDWCVVERLLLSEGKWSLDLSADIHKQNLFIPLLFFFSSILFLYACVSNLLSTFIHALI